MHTVLIAEDEMLVRIGLSTSIDWDKLKLRLVAECANGQSAFEAFRQYRPDIVITDIRMPSLDGLGLIKKIRQEDKRCAIIVITCMADFETLHEAMQYDISSYLVKATMTRDKIQEALLKVQSQLPVPEEDQEAEETLRRVRVASGLLADYALIRRLNAVQYMQGLSNAGYTIPCPPCFLTAHIQDREATPLVRQYVQRMLLERLSQPVTTLCASAQQMILLLLPKLSEQVLHILPSALSDIAGYASQNFGAQLRFVYCPALPGWEALLQLLDRAHILQSRSYLLDSSLLFMDAKGDVADPDIAGWLEELKSNAIKWSLIPSLRGEQTRLIDQIRLSLGKGRVEVLDSLYAFTSFLAKNNPGITPQVLSACHESLQKAASFRSMMAILNAQLGCINPAADTVFSEKIREAISFLTDHLSDDLTLSMMAASIHVSPGYFSTLLKQETGMRFSEFLADLRIRKSKGLLLDQTLPVNEVAIKCGFSDITYFSRFFKKQTGLSPSQWRRS